MYFKDIPNIIDIIGIWPCLVNLFIRNDPDINFYFLKIFNALSVAF